MPDYINQIPKNPKFITVDVKENEQKTPKRITIKYQTTGIFQDISEEIKVKTGESVSR